MKAAMIVRETHQNACVAKNRHLVEDMGLGAGVPIHIICEVIDSPIVPTVAMIDSETIGVGHYFSCRVRDARLTGFDEIGMGSTYALKASVKHYLLEGPNRVCVLFVGIGSIYVDKEVYGMSAAILPIDGQGMEQRKAYLANILNRLTGLGITVVDVG